VFICVVEFLGVCVVKKILPVFLSLCILMVMPLTVKAEEITVKSGTEIPLSFMQNTDSKKMNQFDKIPVIITKDVLVNNKVIFKQGDTGTVNVYESAKPGCFGRGGKIDIRDARIKDVYGNEYLVNLPISLEGNQNWFGVVLPSIGLFSIILLPVLGPFALLKGENPKIRSSQQFYATVTNPININL